MKIDSLLAIGAGLIISVASMAQTAREDFRRNKDLSASNYVAYDNVRPDDTYKYTPSPKNYAPFYISNYARHGSRWLIVPEQYSDLVKTLGMAEKYGKLTDTGKDVLEKIREFVKTCKNRLGELTPVGERQHHGIAKRMANRFPEVFTGDDVYVDARSTVVIRSILSMTAECEELMAFNPKIKMHNDVSESLQWYMNGPIKKRIQSAVDTVGAIGRHYEVELTHPSRLMGVLFNDPVFVAEHIDAAKLMQRLFDFNGNLQSHDAKFTFNDIFTEDELYDLWKIKNITWYVRYGAAPASKGIAPYSQANLLRNIISTADTIIANKNHGATLRFGHEINVMPLAVLLELGDCAKAVEDLDNLDKEWLNYRIYPMGCNIQLVFYRPTKGKGDILVKALLNEHEMSMPVKTENYPYYKWDDLRSYYLGKLDAFDKE